MAECGLHIPADDGVSSPFSTAVLADIGDEQSIEQSLSTFSSHMKNIVDILKICDDSTLILLTSCARAPTRRRARRWQSRSLSSAAKCGSKIAATTHYAELKLYAMRTNGVINASCEFNVETLQPTYRLLIGIPGKSNAFAISKSWADDAILEDARSMVSQNDVNFEDVLNQLGTAAPADGAGAARGRAAAAGDGKAETAVRGILPADSEGEGKRLPRRRKKGGAEHHRRCPAHGKRGLRGIEAASQAGAGRRVCAGLQ